MQKYFNGTCVWSSVYGKQNKILALCICSWRNSSNQCVTLPDLYGCFHCYSSYTVLVLLHQWAKLVAYLLLFMLVKRLMHCLHVNQFTISYCTAMLVTFFSLIYAACRSQTSVIQKQFHWFSSLEQFTTLQVCIFMLS